MRGQTTLDFAIGVSVFLLTVAFVLAFVPGMVQPFTSNPQEKMSVADRVATQLVQEMLAGGDPYVLDTDCTVEFFRTDATGGVACPFAENDLSSGGTLPGRLGINTDHEIQVRIQGDVNADGTNTLLCWDATNRLLVEQGAATCDVPFEQRTDSPPSKTGSTSSAIRIASLRSYDTRIEVQTW